MTEHILGQSVLASCISVILQYQALYRNNIVNRCEMYLLKNGLEFWMWKRPNVHCLGSLCSTCELLISYWTFTSLPLLGLIPSDSCHRTRCHAICFLNHFIMWKPWYLDFPAGVHCSASKIPTWYYSAYIQEHLAGQLLLWLCRFLSRVRVITPTGYMCNCTYFFARYFSSDRFQVCGTNAYATLF